MRPRVDHLLLPEAFGRNRGRSIGATVGYAKNFRTKISASQPPKEALVEKCLEHRADGRLLIPSQHTYRDIIHTPTSFGPTTLGPSRARTEVGKSLK